MDLKTEANVTQAVPFFGVWDMDRSIRFYVDGLSFRIIHRWDVEGRLRWCWLELGGAALMLQTFVDESHANYHPQGKLGEGVTICFQCLDALAIYRAICAKGISAGRPVVGNGMWEFNLHDPDGYNLSFESPTDLPEDTEYTAEQ